MQKKWVSEPRVGFKLYRNESVHSACSVICAVNGGQGGYVSAWVEKPYEFLPNGKRAYLDEQDVVTFLNPPKELIPLDSLLIILLHVFGQKKIDDIPQERCRRLLHLLEPKLISRAWEIPSTRYEEPKLMNRSSFQLLSNEDGVSLEYYNCPTSGGNSSAHYYTGVVSAALTVWGYRVTRDSEQFFLARMATYMDDLLAVADIIRTTLGPRSMLKMLLDASGGNPFALSGQILLYLSVSSLWPYEAAAVAFEAIPRTLAQNCGVNVIRTMTALQGKV
ncbi:putative chaperonin TCP-1, groEL-like equatorial domain-containing protein [Rosa chinensis]|uniref:Putative chaperonin TCP-1, groEL-like equatorial domain-containing protein n=1 Tax=Rosa chinensis TaxID=74649 RepID=A0A2P6SP26_ROSCH|nr:putative chaperonin TCP-1, groEL-like equatorial domain-containing protein [Rosa chinensis]